MCIRQTLRFVMYRKLYESLSACLSVSVFAFIRLKVHSHYAFFAFFLQFEANTKNEFYTYSLHLTQHPIGAMLQFDATATADADADADANANANANAHAWCE